MNIKNLKENPPIRKDVLIPQSAKRKQLWEPVIPMIREEDTIFPYYQESKEVGMIHTFQPLFSYFKQ